MASIRIGVIGVGNMGARHALNVQRHVAGLELAALYDFDWERARQVAAQMGDPLVFDDPLGLIQSDQVDAVIVASPDPTHVEFVLACLRCNKPVLCEKPLAASAAEARRVVDAEVASGRRQVAVGFMRRFDPQHLAVQQAVASGDLGRAIAYKGVHRNVAFPYRITGEAVLTSSASHDIDAARWLLGQEVTQVFVRGVRSRASFSAEARDLLLLQLALSGDCLAAVEVFVSAAYGYEVAAEIVGEQGVAVTTQPDLAAVRLRGAHAVAVSGDWLERFQPAYLAELAQWAQSIRSEQAFAGASAWDGYMSLLAIDACIQSLQRGLPVDVPSIARPALYGGSERRES